MSELPKNLPPGIQLDPSLQALIGQLRELVRDARSHALRAVDAIQVRTCWEIGRHIVEFEQGGASRAEYGKRLLPRLAESLTAEFGRGFDVSNLRYMRLFYSVFPIRDAVRHELSWTHYRTLLRVENSSFPRSAWECIQNRSAVISGLVAAYVCRDAERHGRRSHAERGNDNNAEFAL